MIKKLLPHIAFHISTHHMSLIADIIFAKPLNDVHRKHGKTDRKQRLQYDRRTSGKYCFCHNTQDLRIGKIDQTDHCRTDQIQKKYDFIW